MTFISCPVEFPPCLTGRSSGGEVHLFQVLHEEGAVSQIGKCF